MKAIVGPEGVREGLWEVMMPGALKDAHRSRQPRQREQHQGVCGGWMRTLRTPLETAVLRMPILWGSTLNKGWSRQAWGEITPVVYRNTGS